MRILYLCHRIPYPPDKGDKMRAYRQVRAIAERHEVDLFTLAHRAEDLEGESVLRRYCRNVTVVELRRPRARLRALPALLTDKPLSIAYFYSAELDAKIQNALLRRSYDRIFVYCSSMAQYVHGMRDIPAVLDLVEVDSDKWIQHAGFAPFPVSAIYRREARCLRNYERKICKRFPAVLVETDREAQLVRRIWERAGVHVITNGIDAAYFDPNNVRPCSTEPVIVFTGDMTCVPNQEAVKFFAQRVLPLVRKAVPDSRFLIVGRNPSRSVRRLRNIEGVTITGTVRDIRPYLAAARVSVAPFSVPGGIQNKILEGMAYELPVVATPRAVRGLTQEIAEIIETGETAQELSNLIVPFLRDAALARTRGMEGRQRVVTEYNWDRFCASLLELLETSAFAQRPRALAATLGSAGKPQ